MTGPGGSNLRKNFMLVLFLCFVCSICCTCFEYDLCKRVFADAEIQPHSDVNEDMEAAFNSHFELVKAIENGNRKPLYMRGTLFAPLPQLAKETKRSSSGTRLPNSLVKASPAALKDIIEADDVQKLKPFMYDHVLPVNYSFEGMTLLKHALSSKKWEIVSFLIESGAKIDDSDMLNILQGRNERIFVTLFFCEKFPTIIFGVAYKNLELVEALLQAGVNPWLDPNFFVEDLLKCSHLDIIEKILAFPDSNSEAKFTKFASRILPNVSLASQAFRKVKSLDPRNAEALKKFELLCRYGPIPHDLTPKMTAHLPIDILKRYLSEDSNLSMTLFSAGILKSFAKMPYNDENLTKLYTIFSLHHDPEFSSKSLLYSLILRSCSQLPTTYQEFQTQFFNEMNIKIRYLEAIVKFCPLAAFFKILSKSIRENPRVNLLLLLNFFKVWELDWPMLPDELQGLATRCGSFLRSQVACLMRKLRKKCGPSKEPRLSFMVRKILRENNLEEIK